MVGKSGEIGSSGFTCTYWCWNGISGTFTLTSLPISGAQMPVALITTSVLMTP
jgi:hypothetical protein